MVRMCMREEEVNEQKYSEADRMTRKETLISQFRDAYMYIFYLSISTAAENHSVDLSLSISFSEVPET